MRRIAQPCAAKVKIASRSFTWSMLAIVAAHTPGLAGQCAALRHPSRWYILKPFISFPGGTLSLTADRLDRLVLHGSDGFGVSQRVLAGTTDWQFHSIMLPHFLGRSQKRVIGAEIDESSLQRARIATVLNSSPLTTGTLLAAAPPIAQGLLGDRDVAVSGGRSQEFCFLYWMSLGFFSWALSLASCSDFSDRSVSSSFPSLRICSLARASASCAVQPSATD